MTAFEQLLFWVEENNHEVYEKYLVDAYEEQFGPHFDEKRAKEAVAKMRSTNERGEQETGEHWSVDEVQAAIGPTEHMMKEKDTIWDAYVAINMWYHDLGKNYRSHTDAYANLWIITDAMTWAFADEDAPDGKIYRYIKAIA